MKVVAVYCAIIVSLFAFVQCFDDNSGPLDPKRAPYYYALHMASNNYKYDTAYDFLVNYEAYKAILESLASQPPAPEQALGPAPGQAPGPAPGQAPGPAPGPAPGQAPGPAPEQTPGPAPGQAFGSAPGQAAGPAPGQAFGQAPGQAFGHAPGQAFGQTPGQAFGQTPGQALYSNPQTIYSMDYLNNAAPPPQSFRY